MILWQPKVTADYATYLLFRVLLGECPFNSRPACKASHRDKKFESDGNCMKNCALPAKDRITFIHCSIITG